MHLDRKPEKCLKVGIDFDTFHLVSVEPVNDVYAVIFIARKVLGRYQYFNVRYGELTIRYFATIESAKNFTVENGLISRLKANAINNRYHNVYRGGNN